jgi:ABC-type transport system involved in cytochrome c biogenesis ATPase subunit
MAALTRDLPVSFEVAGLFGKFGHSVPLPTREAPLRFVTAPNGYGKSTLLRLFADLASRQWHRLADVDYEQIRLSFQSGDVLTVVRSRTRNTGSGLRLILSNSGVEVANYELTPAMLRKAAYRPANAFQRIITSYQSDRPVVGNAKQWAGFADSGLHDEQRRFKPRLRVPEQIEQRLKTLRACYLDVNRLWARSTSFQGSNHRQPAVAAIARAVTDELLQARLAYAADSREAERTFAYRVIDALQNPNSSIDGHRLDVMDQYKRLKQIDEFYQELGVSESGLADVPVALLSDNPTAAFILALHMTDIENRLTKLRPKVRRLAVYRDVINEMLSGKQIRFNGQFKSGNNEGQGLEIWLNDGKPMSVESLSAGEQHLLVIFGRMLFDTPPRGGGILLLDEPEISLHPQWQSVFGRMLKKLADVNRCRVLVATHSPMMIGSSWDSEIDLANPKAQ